MNQTMTVNDQSEPRPLVSPGFVWKTMLIIFAFTILTAALSVTGRWMGKRIAMGGHSISTEAKTVIIANERMLIPTNTIRFENQRAGGPMDRLDLYLLWPGLHGYSTEHRRQFNDTEHGQNVLFATIKPRSMALDMTGRLQPVYSRLVLPNPAEQTSGLIAYSFGDDTRYVGEQLLVGSRRNHPTFVARCLEQSALPAPSRNCMRDIDIGSNLSIEYRFSEALLPHWQQLDEAIQAYAAKALFAEQ